MAWNGYFSYDGNEFINVHRTEVYAENLGLSWFRPTFENSALGPMLGDGDYKTPLLDDAPWLDPDVPASADFVGAYPLDVTGIESSSRTSTPTESLGTGGNAGRLRHGTKSVVFSTLILAATEAGADYGVRWLRTALLGSACGPSATDSCFGGDLCFLASPPEVPFPESSSVADLMECMVPYRRYFRKVVFNQGPEVTSKRVTSDGGAVWAVQFTGLVANPYEFGADVPLIQGFLDPQVVVPWANGIEPAGGSIDLDGYIANETECAEVQYTPIYDPLHPAIIPPPSAPSVPLGNYVPPRNWQRRQFTIPKQYVTLWSEMVPQIAIHAHLDPIRNLRVRFYADPQELGEVSQDDPCSFCGDMVVSYVPPSHTLVIDAADEAVYAISPGGIQRRADSLVFASTGKPFDWPALSCGIPYVVTFDLPQTQEPPIIDMSLTPRAI